MTEGAKNSEVGPKSRAEEKREGREGEGGGGLELSVSLSPPAGKSTYKSNDSGLWLAADGMTVGWAETERAHLTGE